MIELLGECEDGLSRIPAMATGRLSIRQQTCDRPIAERASTDRERARRFGWTHQGCEIRPVPHDTDGTSSRAWGPERAERREPRTSVRRPVRGDAGVRFLAVEAFLTDRARTPADLAMIFEVGVTRAGRRIPDRAGEHFEFLGFLG